MTSNQFKTSSGRDLIAELRTKPFYALIADAYRGKSARRSGLPYMNHIREGAFLLNLLYGYDEEVIAAYCLHPLFQGDESLQELLSEGDTRLAAIPPRVIVLGMEYRRVANSYTLRTAIRRPEEIDLGPLKPVHCMLTADKIQNRKDFVKHMQTANDRATYRRTVERTLNYFDSWLARLGVTQERYQELVAQLEQSGVHDDAIEDEQVK